MIPQIRKSDTPKKLAQSHKPPQINRNFFWAQFDGLREFQKTSKTFILLKWFHGAQYRGHIFFWGATFRATRVAVITPRGGNEKKLPQRIKFFFMGEIFFFTCQQINDNLTNTREEYFIFNIIWSIDRKTLGPSRFKFYNVDKMAYI